MLQQVETHPNTPFIPKMGNPDRHGFSKHNHHQSVSIVIIIWRKGGLTVVGWQSYLTLLEDMRNWDSRSLISPFYHPPSIFFIGHTKTKVYWLQQDPYMNIGCRTRPSQPHLILFHNMLSRPSLHVNLLAPSGALYAMMHNFFLKIHLIQGPKGLRAESARAVTGRRCPHSGVG